MIDESTDPRGQEGASWGLGTSYIWIQVEVSQV